jgi:hypothetical protein
MELGGRSRGAEYDSISVKGDIYFDGELVVELANGFQPSGGDVFDLFDWGTKGGVFDSTRLPTLRSGLRWDLSNTYVNGTISVIEGAPDAPNGFAANLIPGMTVELHWTDTTPSADGFEIQRATDQSFTEGVWTVQLPAGRVSFKDENLPAQTTYYYRLRAVFAPLPSEYAGSVHVVTPSRMSDWRWKHFGSPVVAGDSADLSDPDYDGLSNLLEYACNLDPKLSDPRPLGTNDVAGVPKVGRSSDGRLTFTFLRRTTSSAPGITQQAFFSSDMENWSVEPSAMILVDPIDVLWERVMVIDPVEEGGRRFARMEVRE